jgi:hypothetical protein
MLIFAPGGNQSLTLGARTAAALVTEEENAKCHIATSLMGHQLYLSPSNKTIKLLQLLNRVSADFL